MGQAGGWRPRVPTAASGNIHEPLPGMLHVIPVQGLDEEEMGEFWSEAGIHGAEDRKSVV